MQIGRKLGEGAGAEVFAWGDGQVIKLFKHGAPEGSADHEARVTQAAFAAGAPAPEVRAIVSIDGRAGIVYPLYPGETLLAAVFAGRVTPEEAGAVMARVAHSLHAGRYVWSLWSFREWTAYNIDQLRTKAIPEDVLAIVLRVADTLPAGGVLCHGDLHAGNILMTSDGPMAIDWTGALSAHPFVDVARQHLSFTQMLLDARPTTDEAVEIVPGVKVPPDALEGPRREADAGFIRTYAALIGMSAEQLLESIVPYMTVMAAMRMVEPGCSAAEQRRLIEYVRRAGAS